MQALDIFAGPVALARLREHGLRAQDVAVVPAAAGGPKGLILQRLDQWLFGEFLPSAPRERTLVGASIGAWRMAAATQADPADAFRRLGDLYCGQRYPHKPTPAYVTGVIDALLAEFLHGREEESVGHPQHRLHLLTVRGKRLLKEPGGKLAALAGFTLATLDNLASRERLANHMERVVFADMRAPAAWLQPRFDAFETRFVPLAADNLRAALLASGTLPFVMEAVRGIAHAPAGTYWDGGIIDYHLALPYARLVDTAAAATAGAEAPAMESAAQRKAGTPAGGGLVLYPHFVDHIVPGWLDKPLPWRRAARGGNRGWLDNVILVSPSRAFRDTLPRGKLPDRKDFHHYGTDHDARIRDWQKAIGEGARLRDALAAFAEKPDLGRVRPL